MLCGVLLCGGTTLHVARTSQRTKECKLLFITITFYLYPCNIVSFVDHHVESKIFNFMISPKQYNLFTINKI